MSLSEKEKLEEEYRLGRQLVRTKHEYDMLKSKGPKTNEEIDEIINKLDDVLRLNGLLEEYDKWESLVYELADWYEKQGDLRMAKKILPPDMKRTISHYKFQRRRLGLED